MSGHDRVLMLAATAVDFPLSPAERDELEAHLRDCAPCRTTVAGIRLDVQSLDAIARTSPPVYLGAAIAAAALRQPPGRSQIARQAALMGLLLSLLLATILVALLIAGGGNRRLAADPPPGLHVAAVFDALPAGTSGTGAALADDVAGAIGAAFGEGSLWVTSATAVERIDPATGASTSHIEVGNHPSRIAFGEGSVWVTVSGDDTVSRIDPVTNRIVARIPVGRTPLGIVVASGSVWVADAGADALVRIDPTRNLVATSIQLGRTPVDVAETAGSVWVSTHRGSGLSAETAVVRIDPASGALIASVPGGSRSLVSTATDVWFLDAIGGGVARMDVATNRVTARVPIHNGGAALAAGGGYVWVFSSSGFVERIDPATNAIRDEILASDGTTGGSLVSGTYGAGGGWLYRYDAGRVTRIDPSN